jgi:hypothetical protein
MGFKLRRRISTGVFLILPACLLAGQAFPASLPADSVRTSEPAPDSAHVDLERLGKEMESQQEFLGTTLGKARALAMAKLKDGRFDEAWKLPEAIAAKYPGEPFILFWPWEEEFMGFLSGRWDLLLDPGRWNRDFSTGLNGRTGPERDDFGRQVYDLLVLKRLSIRENLTGAVLEPYKKEFLQILLNGRLSKTGLKDAPSRDEVNRRAEEWLSRYPGNPYATFVRNNVRYVLKPGWFGGGADFSLGLNFPRGGLGANFDRRFAFGFGLELMLWRLSLRGNLSSDFWAGSENDYRFRGRDWKGGDDYALTYAEFQAGVEVLRTRNWLLIPYGSWGGLEFSNETLKKDLDEDDDGDAHITEPCWGWGIHVQRLFPGPAGAATGVGYLGMEAGIRYPQLWRSFPGLSGSEIILQFHLGMKGRRWARDF